MTGIDAGGSADAGVTVRTPDDRIDADYVVDAAGAWAGRVAETAGLDLPIAPRRRQLAVVEPDVDPDRYDSVDLDWAATAVERARRRHRRRLLGPRLPARVVDLCLDGETSLVDVSPLSSDRFADGDLVDERNVA